MMVVVLCDVIVVFKPVGIVVTGEVAVVEVCDSRLVVAVIGVLNVPAVCDRDVLNAVAGDFFDVIVVSSFKFVVATLPIERLVKVGLDDSSFNAVLISCNI